MGNSEVYLRPLLEQDVCGTDRIVPVGQTIAFDCIWDGYDLLGWLTRKIMNYYDNIYDEPGALHMKMLYIVNVGQRIGNFSYSSMIAAKELGIEFHIAGNWTGYTNLKDKKQDEKKYGIKIHQIDFIRTPYDPRNIKAYKQIIRLIEEENIDCIHCNTPIGGVIGRLAGKKCKVKKIIYQAHGFHFYKGAPKLNWMLYYPIERWLVHYTDALITINNEDYELAKNKFRLCNGGKVYYVPGVGIDTSLYKTDENVRAEKRVELGIPIDAFVILSVGELNKNKNNSVIIKALERLKEPNIHYILCGAGEQEKTLQEQANEANLQSNIHFLGYRTDVKEIYAMSECFVLPSYREGLSRSLMEAMASGLPCIVSKIRGNVDLITDEGGYCCNPYSINDFAVAIKSLYLNRNICKDMGEHNQGKINEYDTMLVKKILIQIYQRVLLY